MSQMPHFRRLSALIVLLLGTLGAMHPQSTLLMDGGSRDSPFISYSRVFHQNGTPVTDQDTGFQVRAFLMDDDSRLASPIREFVLGGKEVTVPTTYGYQQSLGFPRIFIVDQQDTMVIDLPGITIEKIMGWGNFMFDSLVVMPGYYQYNALPPPALGEMDEDGDEEERSSETNKYENSMAMWAVAGQGLTPYTIRYLSPQQWLIAEPVTDWRWLKLESHEPEFFINASEEWLVARDTTRAILSLAKAVQRTGGSKQRLEVMDLTRRLLQISTPASRAVVLLTGWIQEDSIPAFWGLRAFFQEEAGKYTEAIQDYTYWINHCPASGSEWTAAVRARARSYVRQGAYNDAVRDYSLLPPIETPVLSMNEPNPAARLLFEQGAATYRASDHANGLKAMTYAAEMGYGYCGQYQLSRKSAELMLCDSLIADSPLMAGLYLVRGIATYWYAPSISWPRNERLCREAALADLMLAEALGCRDARLYLFRAAVFRDLGRNKDALRNASLAIRRAPNDPRGYAIRATLWGMVTSSAKRKTTKDQQRQIALQQKPLPTPP